MSSLKSKLICYSLEHASNHFKYNPQCGHAHGSQHGHIHNFIINYLVSLFYYNKDDILIGERKLYMFSFQEGDFTKYVLEGAMGSRKGRTSVMSSAPGASHFKSNGNIKVFS